MKSMRNSAKTSFTLLAVACVALFGAVVQPALSQTASFERAQGREMLNAIKSDIRKGYYDPTFRGKDLDAHFKAAEEKIGQAPSMGYILAIIAQALIDFDDSHTYFVLPPPSAHVEPGWRLRMIGDKLYVVAVRPKSDAEVKGLAPGDRVLTIDGFTPSRDPRWQISFAYYLQKANPQTIFLVEKPDGSQQTITVIAEVKEGRRMLNLGNSNGTDLFNLIRESQNDAYLNRHRYYEIGEQAIIWKMPNFELSEAQISELMGKARKRKALILDLRGNGGGSEAVLQRLVGHLFDHDIKIGDLKRRKETKPLLARTRSDEVFKGQLVILLDSESGSAAEVLAPVVQL